MATTIEKEPVARVGAMPLEPVSTAPVAHPAASAGRWFILLGLITAAIMQVLDTTIVNVALPQMAGNLGCTNQEVGWVVTGYILSNVIVLPMTAFLTARFGRKRYLSASIIVFIIASFFCGTSHTLGEMVFWRVLQGAGGAALLATAQATLVQVFPPEEQGIVQPIFMMGLIVAPTLGPTLGGWITDNYTWNWCFLINVPIGILSAFLVITFLHDTVEPKKATVDWPGIGLLAVGLGALQYVLEEGQSNDWFNDPLILRLSVVSVVTLSLLLWWQLSPRNKQPVVDFRVLKNPVLAASLFLYVALGFGLYGGSFLYPLLAQTILNFTPLQTGLALLPGGIATAVSIMVCGQIMNRKGVSIDPRWLIGFGTAVTMLSLWNLGRLSTLTGENDTMIALLLRGFAMGFIFVPINQVAFASLKRAEVQQGSGLMNLSRQLGGSFGISILATYLATHAQMHRADLVGNFSVANPEFVTRLHGAAGVLMAHGYSPTSAMQGAAALMDGTLTRQSLMMSYNDSFLMILLFNLVTAPAILLLGRASTRFSDESGNSAAHMD
ncbi:MAG: DHA2 family efflux MFS transporter permease subunit [Capsulimonadaceae bacterium]